MTILKFLKLLKWSLRIVAFLSVAVVLQYTLPSRDIVLVTDTYNRMTTIGDNAMFYATPDVGSNDHETRDIRFVEAAYPDGSVIVYRNEDTGWVWPPYFKYDSSNLQAEASQLRSTPKDPTWVAITHYGWRIPFFSIYPNAVAVTAISGPDVKLFPWVNIVVIVMIALAALFLRALWRQFLERTILPVFGQARAQVEAIEAQGDAVAGVARRRWSLFSGWLGTWRGKPRM
ncbi:DUF1523 family protein [Defluviimonas salinarum]|uniref:DUF1523 family protein n=1 Tax=Defluviimonas salinarum TaxID=2992147 RepID=A0ABT3J5K8_9RHOB|nr:DUF1523 family protein [Defluviimonas salinarum]MCW3782958.1 DUF1523 family protein [Defluviimonas salinarum]